jgi:hypothetical protein
MARAAGKGRTAKLINVFNHKYKKEAIKRRRKVNAKERKFAAQDRSRTPAACSDHV